MHFISQWQLMSDIREWSSTLPQDIIGVAGIPRSGVLPAVQLALHRNLHLTSIEDLIRGATPWRHALRWNVPEKHDGRVLILDDSINTGGTVRRYRQKLSVPNGRFLFGAVYYRELLQDVIEFGFRQVPFPRCFEWMLFHSNHMAHACLDLDGVLCIEPDFREGDSGVGLERWLNHLESAAPLHIPTLPVLAVVTSRLEKYRSQTEAWLRLHGVRYKHLLMSPYETSRARRAAADHGERKAACYCELSEARLFIESSETQSKQIARFSGKPVLCTDLMELF